MLTALPNSLACRSELSEWTPNQLTAPITTLIAIIAAKPIPKRLARVELRNIIVLP
jgi:hypothetical protein